MADRALAVGQTKVQDTFPQWGYGSVSSDCGIDVGVTARRKRDGSALRFAPPEGFRALAAWFTEGFDTCDHMKHTAHVASSPAAFAVLPARGSPRR